MSSNSFGDIFTLTSWGESHGKAVGVVVDGVPSGLKLSYKDIQLELNKRKPGSNKLVSQRKEKDKVVIYSGLFRGYTTGAPVLIMVFNCSYNKQDYDKLKTTPRPGHADLGYYFKYHYNDYNGGGRSSGRETIARVAAGAIAKKILKRLNIFIACYTTQIGNSKDENKYHLNYKKTIKLRKQSNLLCLNKNCINSMTNEIENAIKNDDSIGGIIEGKIFGLKIGLGDPVFKKLEAELGYGILGIGGVKGFEIGLGFKSATMKGSKFNDIYIVNNKNKIRTKTNNCGGIIGGITNGMDITFRVSIRPTATIKKEQKTINLKNYKTKKIKMLGNHDPCIVLRIIPVIEAMAAIVILNSIMRNMNTKLDNIINNYNLWT